MACSFNQSIALPSRLNRIRSPIASHTSFNLNKSHPILRRLYSEKPQENHSSTSKSSGSGFKQFLNDLSLGYSLPISFVIGIGLYGYLQSQLPESSEHQGSNRKPSSSKEPLPPLIELSNLDDIPMIDPDTQIEFSKKLESNENNGQEPLRLIGLGVRTVSFLGVRVYSAGFYVDPRVLRALRVVPGWNEDVTKEKLLSIETDSKSITLPTSTTSPIDEKSTSVIEKPISGESMMRNLITVPVQFAIQIAPARSTDFTHLRDGFCRSLTARVTHATKKGLLTDFEAERASESINQFRSFFPAGVSVPKGKTILLRKTSSGSLSLEYGGKRLGQVEDPLIARELFLAYFSDVDPISPKFKESVAEGFEKMYK
ncbi:uncharacterized protein MELLADRAFT_96331 [Melampsora larici-populina 98AG31]|uniref:Chalcone isomerase domain-containing protein n=1 Tax=Melampsora larici-populina (strain 98AG31 / pathotype 3-4-7) TaxID=747676 RepID=F4RED8_MELLP|nr:uncharacterized protein MELLADRAFT_96331 [Melampsora larici-populina 98AG31]EGG09289.1 hypothetical protein MELLADRAFT_96331 [Melampsora larici-populina 98AG31]